MAFQVLDDLADSGGLEGLVGDIAGVLGTRGGEETGAWGYVRVAGEGGAGGLLARAFHLYAQISLPNRCFRCISRDFGQNIG
jgi:hypothetical protein